MRQVARLVPALVLATLLPAADKKPIPAPTDAANYNIPLWPEGKVPLATGSAPLDTPFLTVFLPPAPQRNGASVIVAPGGSNIMLMYGGEGMNIAERYNDWGVAAFVLTYRLSPRYNEDARVLDGKRAIQVVRSHAAEWKLDPAKIGYIGFSAGSNMGRTVVAQSAPGDPNSADPIDRVSSRPDYARPRLWPRPRHPRRATQELSRPSSSSAPPPIPAPPSAPPSSSWTSPAPAPPPKSTSTRKAATASATASATPTSPTGCPASNTSSASEASSPEAKQ